METAWQRSSDFCRCAIYTRQSRTADSEFSSCQAQFDACLQFVQSQAGVGWYYGQLRYDDEGASGESLDRPGLQRLWADIDAGRIDRLVIHRLDRLSRKVAHCSWLLDHFRQRGVALTIVSSPELGATASDALMLNLFATFAEFERAIIGERMADARAALKRRGKRVAGAVPFGYSTDPVTKQLVPDRTQSRRVLAIFERAAKGETPRQIAEHANRRGWRTKCTTSRTSGAARGGNRWTPRQVLATLANPVYLGLIRVGDETQQGVHEALVTRDLFERASAQVSSRRSRAQPKSREAGVAWPLRGLITCGKCGRPMSPSISGYRNLRYRYYRCRSHAGGRAPCSGASVPAEEIERFVCQLLGDDTAEDLQAMPERQAFCKAWVALGDRHQRRLLSKVLGQIVFDAQRGWLQVVLQAGANEALAAEAR